MPEETKGPESAATPQAEIEKLRAKAAKADEYLDLAKRAKADFINYQDRARREKEQITRYSIDSFVREFLPAVDSLQQSVRTLETSGDAKTVLDGVRLIEKEFLRVLSKNGIRPIEAGGKPFDPLFHEAVAVVESREHPDNSVLEVVRGGWMLHDRVLRPAGVRVTRRPAPEDQVPTNGENPPKVEGPEPGRERGA